MRVTNLVFAAPIFLGAFLLFQVQPLIAKYILPWYGGSPQVWTTCLLFFQVVLLGGYAYAHLLTRRLGPKAQAIVHTALLTAAVALLPITPSMTWRAGPGEDPTWRILLLLASCLGLSYLLLSATGPLLQSWISRASARSPYRFYALSNIGSLAALVSYPFLVEPMLSRQAQVSMWSWTMGGFAVLCATASWRAALARGTGILPVCSLDVSAGDIPSRYGADSSLEGSSARHPQGPDGPDTHGRDDYATRLLWLALPACGCLLLMAITNAMSEDIGAIPFLWIAPLTAYLLSFIICFDRPQWYRRPLFAFLLGASMLPLFWVMSVPRPPTWALATIYSGVLFLACMACHGELYRLRPPANRLTNFYLMLAAGGAVGGILGAIVAPLVFSACYELHVGLPACCLLVTICWVRDGGSSLRRTGHKFMLWAVLLVVAMLIGILVFHARTKYAQVVFQERNFYGVLSIREDERQGLHYRALWHGATCHGIQLLNGGAENTCTTYYTASGGVGRAIEALRQRGRPLRVGVVGLGIGTLAAHGLPGDTFRFYEINADVIRIANERFSFLSRCQAKTEVVLGDARMSLEGEAPQQFDLLVLDAFSGDSVPTHLLTKEAFQQYRRHLAPGGVLSAHITNRYFDLRPVVASVAQSLGMHATCIEHQAKEADVREYSSIWVLACEDAALLTRPEIASAASAPFVRSDERPWTDDHVNLLAALKH